RMARPRSLAALAVGFREQLVEPIEIREERVAVGIEAAGGQPLQERTIRSGRVAGVNEVGLRDTALDQGLDQHPRSGRELGGGSEELWNAHPPGTSELRLGLRVVREQNLQGHVVIDGRVRGSSVPPKELVGSRVAAEEPADESRFLG